MTFLSQVTANGQRPAWALKLDVANFFPSIHKETLYEIISRTVRHPELLWLTSAILFHDPTTNYRFQSRGRYIPGPESRHYPVPPHKSLFGKRNERGLPIGNLTSQFWGNVYLNELDQFVKRTLKCRCYVRYVDDMVLLAEDRDTLVVWREAIAEFLRERLKLELRPDMTEPLAVGRGIEFVGWKAWWNRHLPRRRTVRSLRAQLDDFERAAVRPAWKGLARGIDLRRQDEAGSVGRLRSVLASYSGHLRHGTTLRAWEEVWDRYPWLAALFNRRAWRIEERWPVRGMASASDLRAQYWRVARRAGDDSLVFFQVGRFIEFYGPQRLLAVRSFGLRTVALPRAEYAFRAGFPVELSGRYALRAIRRGLIVVEVRQESMPLYEGCLPRLPCVLLVPTGDGELKKIAK